MKSHLFKIVPLLIGVAASAPMFSGCASTPTRASTGEYIDDSVITAKVKAALAADKTVSAMAVNVETFKGVVQLSGFVNSPQEKRQAQVVAARVNGVRSVQNNISLKTDASRSSG